MWGTAGTWGTGVAWGTGTGWGTGVAWGTGAEWGTGVAWGTGAECISKSALLCTGLYKAAQSHRHHRKVPTIAELHSMVPTCTYCTAFTELPVQCFTDYTT